jgi:hypothetical protein
MSATECEWNPAEGRPVLADEPSHALATMRVGATSWLLCVDCAALPRFKSYKKRPLSRSARPPPSP